MPITKYIRGDLLSHSGPIAHGVNCMGKMASGVAKAIREKYPEHYEDYIDCTNLYQDQNEKRRYLGKYVKSKCEDGKIIFGVFSQLYYGYDSKRYVNYAAIANGFSGIHKLSKNNFILGIPKIGAGLGGGDWNIIEQIINDATPNLEIWVYEL